ncbi:hypothetical protein GCM10007108_04890 [Thermogymnomonas acidicola]|uniref:PIN domain-containing protein n=1 Tax=Thermogymnomonas acidicola TaxID=399579 RepID=A0AA37BQE0_9ARCH|nr:hypothetical protein [Thermogymnomonas acidicola]GGM69818.1 hypothetical protein GCM10007108_04890 [Thermogymnomonas acidicola]
MRPFVLDTSAILSGNLDIADGEFVVTEMVASEVRNRVDRLRAQLLLEGALYRPSERTVGIVREAAERTGDIGEVSEADISVVAAAIETGGEVLTDDYAIQNLCREVGVPFSGVSIGPITHSIRWAYMCTGCGRIYRRPVEACDVCGHALRRVSRSRKRIR